VLVESPFRSRAPESGDKGVRRRGPALGIRGGGPGPSYPDWGISGHLRRYRTPAGVNRTNIATRQWNTDIRLGGWRHRSQARCRLSDKPECLTTGRPPLTARRSRAGESAVIASHRDAITASDRRHVTKWPVRAPELGEVSSMRVHRRHRHNQGGSPPAARIPPRIRTGFTRPPHRWCLVDGVFLAKASSWRSPRLTACRLTVRLPSRSLPRRTADAQRR
jgi:hypothetical protein